MTNTWADVWKFRKTLYGSLAAIFLEPIQKDNKEVLTQNYWVNFPLEVANPKLSSGLEQLKACTSKLEELSSEKQIEKVMVEYTQLFLGPGVPKAPPFESFYQSNKKLFFGQTTFDMKKVLNKNGLESKRKNKQPEDHIGLEILFISVLTEKLQKTGQESHVSIVEEQISFIDKHLLSWIPELCRDAKEHGSVGFYGGLIELVWGVLLWDKELLEEFVTCHKEDYESMC